MKKADFIIYEDSKNNIYDTERNAKAIVNLLKEKGEKVSTAESCTGGLIAGSITSVSGASDVFDRGYVTYANSAKEELLGVKKETLDTFGAVSADTAYEMAKGAAKAAWYQRYRYCRAHRRN